MSNRDMDDFFSDPDNTGSDGFSDFGSDDGFSDFGESSFGNNTSFSDASSIDFGNDNLDFGNTNTGLGSSSFDTDSEEDEFSNLGSSQTSGEDGYNLGGYTPTLPQNETISSTGGTKKKNMRITLVLGLAGVLVLVVTLVMANLFINKPSSTPKNVKTEYEDKSAVMQSEKGSKVNNQPSINSGSAVGGWTKLDQYTSLNEGTLITSSFTITDITFYATAVNGQADKQVKTVLTGNISGLVGTYQIEVPYTTGGKLSIGNSFDISYNLIEANGYKVIDGIVY